MKYGLAFLVGDALRRSVERPARLILWLLSVAAVLLSGTALFLIPTGSEAGRTDVEGFLVAHLSPDPSEAVIARLGSDIWVWPGVDAVTFRFPGDADPVSIAQRSLFVRLLAPDYRSLVEPRLRTLTEVVGVEYHERRVGGARVPLVSRLGALAALVAALSLSLWLGHRAVTQAAALWERELALLRSCGSSPITRRVPFFVLGALAGLAGGAVHVLLCWVLWSWGGDVPYLGELVPSFPYVWGALVFIGLLLGIGLGLVGSLISAFAHPSHS